MTVRTRFAPSPTGFLHIGGVRTALYAWLYARKHGGQFILRIDDTDKEREVEGSIEHIIESLAWLGIAYDEGPGIGGTHNPYIQSERLPLYTEYARRLVEAGHAYPDPYTKTETEAFRAQAESEKRAFLFREHRPERSDSWDSTRSLRFRVPTLKRYEWKDAVRGTLSAGEEALDDFILMKSDGYPTYNFAHIVDDIEMGITHVMRGEEFISSTPKFLSLYEALGKEPPEFATLPPILGPGGNKKLSKRDGAKDVLDYRAEGYLPEAILNYLALLGWNPGTDQEFFSPEQLTAAFTIDRVQKSGARFDEAKFLHLNQEWMRTLTDEDFLVRGEFDSELDASMLHKAVPLLKERARTMGEARDMLKGELAGLFSAPTLARETLTAKEPADRPGLTKTALEGLLEAVKGLPEDVSAEAVKEALMPLADAEEAKGKGGRGAVLWPLRYALSGQERSPDPFTLVSLLGLHEAISRIQTALGIM
ncbi:MAG TPA: glutamate--tRNA ligase [Candidatus Paceibacterota bacterium]|nr:glutamate--tRNA ligase [Candidatus Paceibacterota bacterium]